MVFRFLLKFFGLDTRKDSSVAYYKLSINISNISENDATLSWHPTEAMRIPSNDQHLVLRTFAEETLRIDVVSLLEHTPIDELKIPLYWQNLSPEAQKYTYCMHFGIRPELSCDVIFGSYDPKGFGTPFDGKLVPLEWEADPFQGANSYSLLKPRTDSWIKLPKKSSSWTSSIRGRKGSRRSSKMRETTISPVFTPNSCQKGSDRARVIHETASGSNAGTGGSAAPYTRIVIYEKIEASFWTLLNVAGNISNQHAKEDDIITRVRSAPQHPNVPTSTKPEDGVRYVGLRHSADDRDSGLPERDNVSTHSKTDVIRHPQINISSSSLFATARRNILKDESPGNDERLSLSLHVEGQNKLSPGDAIPESPDGSRPRARSIASKYSRSSSTYNVAPSESSEGEEGPDSLSMSKPGKEKVVAMSPATPDKALLTHSVTLAKSSQARVADINAHHSKPRAPEDTPPDVSQALRPSLSSSYRSLSISSVTLDNPIGSGNNISEPMRRFLESDVNSDSYNRKPSNPETSSNHSPRKPKYRRKYKVQNSGKIQPLMTPKRVLRSASDEVDPALIQKAKDHWTWDSNANAYFHLDSDSGSMVWYEDSGCEGG